MSSAHALLRMEVPLRAAEEDHGERRAYRRKSSQEPGGRRSGELYLEFGRLIERRECCTWTQDRRWKGDLSFRSYSGDEVVCSHDTAIGQVRPGLSNSLQGLQLADQLWISEPKSDQTPS